MELLRIQISAANLLFSSPSSLLVSTISPAARPPLDVASSQFLKLEVYRLYDIGIFEVKICFPWNGLS
ncbi:hypothetical protein LXL04_031612 [Taraxacum kok-saghyz]